MALSLEPRSTTGIWGPSFEAVLPEHWLVDAGQSATGALLDHLVRFHGAGAQPTFEMHDRIAARIMALRSTEGDKFAAGLHVLPDFHGNRSPLADPLAVGVISGLTLDASFDNLCRIYWRTAISIALSVRHILDTLNASGFDIDVLHVTGGPYQESDLDGTLSRSDRLYIDRARSGQWGLTRHSSRRGDSSRSSHQPQARSCRHGIRRPRTTDQPSERRSVCAGLPDFSNNASTSTRTRCDHLEHFPIKRRQPKVMLIFQHSTLTEFHVVR